MCLPSQPGAAPASRGSMTARRLPVVRRPRSARRQSRKLTFGSYLVNIIRGSDPV